MHNTHFALLGSPLGSILARECDEELTGVWFSGQNTAPNPSPSEMIDASQSRCFTNLATQLGEYFSGERRHFDLRYNLQGTPWQRRVWRRLKQVNYGETVTYGQLAAEIGHPSAQRAVRTAVGRNPLSIIVPCHRVIPAAGGVGNYAGGKERKQWLLQREGAEV